MVTVQGNMAEFAFYRPQADSVHLVGEFNNWQKNELPMTRTAEGYWVARLMLPPGTFRFRYFADGQWYTDYAAFGIECGPFGPNSVVRTQETQRKTMSARDLLCGRNNLLSIALPDLHLKGA